jgi:hypothetical protein
MNMRVLFSVLGILLLAIALGIAMVSPGCSRIKSTDDIYGTYLADYAVASEKLTLNKDGTFSQELTIKATGNHDTANGKWYYESSSGYVVFDNQLLVPIDGFRKYNPNYKKPKDGTGVYPVDRYLWNIYVGSSEGVQYKKQ